MANQKRITGSRLGRLGLLGKLAGGIAGGMLSEGARRIGQGERPRLNDLLLTPANTRRITDSLSQMRGAAMKIGQLISMDNGNLLPAELSGILVRLREDAHSMPLGQVNKVLKSEWGENWQQAFKRFAFTPVAAASIGQVHKAQLQDGRHVAIKLQYPGIRRSIDSDVDNVATLLNTLRLLPSEIDLQPLLAQAKQQLHLEADYRAEAVSMQAFADRIGADPRYRVPDVVAHLSTDKVLVMSFQDGQPIHMLDKAAPETRQRACSAMLELALREVFDWGLVQTDPNFANYLFDADSGQIQLLDFGATRRYDKERRNALNDLLQACRADDIDHIAIAARSVGYLGEHDADGFKEAIVALLRLVTQPVRTRCVYDFGRSELSRQVRDAVIQLRMRQHHGHLPPADILFLHRKLAGLYLLLKQVHAQVDLPLLLDRIDTAGKSATATGSDA